MKQLEARALLDSIRRARVMIVGDLILDEYVKGSATRLSPEAPVPVVEVGEVDVFPGGAANVALNVSRLGARTLLVGVVGDDSEGARLKAILSKEPRLETLFVVDRSRPTTKKTRVIASGHQVVRFDHEVRRPLDAEITAGVIGELERALGSDLGALVLSDYQKGVLGPKVLRAAIDGAKNCKLPCIVDPKLKDFSAYKGATLTSVKRSPPRAPSPAPRQEPSWPSSWACSKAARCWSPKAKRA
jgi:D-beta-D-heptose 7-phosphate kinase / D-beta-D-heptose 1-phosphate adenosyltransferase